MTAIDSWYDFSSSLFRRIQRISQEGTAGLHPEMADSMLASEVCSFCSNKQSAAWTHPCQMVPSLKHHLLFYILGPFCCWGLGGWSGLPACSTWGTVLIQQPTHSLATFDHEHRGNVSSVWIYCFSLFLVPLLLNATYLNLPKIKCLAPFLSAKHQMNGLCNHAHGTDIYRLGTGASCIII